MLLEVAEKVLPQAIKPGLVAYCPTMDLIALATRDEQVHVFRLNGQRVFGVANKATDCTIVQITWKPNGSSFPIIVNRKDLQAPGRILAVAQSTGIILLINSHTGKVIHQVECDSHSQSQICCLGWGLNFMEASSIRARLNQLNEEFTLDEVLSRGFKNLGLDAPLDLPADLASIDIETMLPRLSVLPSAGKDDDVFATRASVDAMFHAKKDSNESADVLLVGFEDGTVYLSIYDFFEIGSFAQVLDKQNLRVVQHCSHPYSSTHGLLMTDDSQQSSEFIFVPADLRLLTDTGRYLSLLASKATQLQNLLRYMEETQAQIYAEFNSSQDLPRKFLRNIEETLQEKEANSFVNAAYHLVATGDCSPSMKEWLVDELGERGHKRWDKAATSGYENLNRFTFQNLLPALDRFGVLISRLRGLSRFQESTSSYGLDTVELDHVLDTLSCLQLLGHSILIKGGAEAREFAAFSKWMRLEIEMQAVEPGSQSAEDTASKYAALDYAAIFQYIQGALLDSGLYELLNVSSSADERPMWETPPETSTMYEIYKKALRSNRDSRAEKRLPGLSALVSRLERQCKMVFCRIAETQKRKVRFGSPILLSKRGLTSFDSRVVTNGEADRWDLCTYYVAMTARETSISQ